MEAAHLKLRSKFHKPFFAFGSDQRSRNQEVPSTPPIITMTEDDVPTSEELSASRDIWSTPTSQSRPTTSATLQDGFSFDLGVDQSSQASNTSPLPLQQLSGDGHSRPTSTHQDFTDNHLMAQKPYEHQYAFQGYAPDMGIGQAYTSDEAIPIFDLDPEAVHRGGYPLQFDEDLNSRRISGSSFTVSTIGASDIPPYEDFSAALSDAPSFCSEYPPTSQRNSWMSSTPLSPVVSPRMGPQSRTELVRTQSRGRASPSPRPNVRSAPYSIDGSRGKRWSTGSYGTMPNRRAPTYLYHAGNDACVAAQHPTSQPPYMMACPPSHQRNSMLLPTQLPSQTLQDTRIFEPPPPLMSHGLFRMLQSNADSQSLYRRYADLSDPPDLFGPLSEEQAPPPEEDLNPSDPDLVPREQELRFEGDLYTPKWVRGHGNKREGWCGICKPGRWLVLKNSAYWYDKSFSHGISAATGSPFQEPLETRRMDGNPDVWEGLCSSCNEWIALVSSKKKGTTWFRHAYKCHSHPKAKDTAKRRRDTSHGRDALIANAPKMTKTEPQVTTHIAAASIPTTHMPVGQMNYMTTQPPTFNGMGLVHNPLSAHPPHGMVLGSNDPYPNMI